MFPFPAKPGLRLLLLVGAAGLLVALMSIVDMFATKPYDGIIAAPHAERGIRVAGVKPGSGAERAGIRPGDVVLGIGTQIVATPGDAAAELIRHEVRDRVRYLVRTGERIREAEVVLQPVLLGTYYYVYYCLLGFLFFFIGLFVVVKKPEESSSRVFFLLCLLFMLFLICRLRPASYYWVDYFVQNTGTLSLFVLPAAFLHFFLIFPEPKRIRFGERTAPSGVWGSALEPLKWIAAQILGSRVLIAVIYLIPPLAYFAHRYWQARTHSIVAAAGAPLISWVLLGDYLLLGVISLAHSALRAPTPARRRQVLEVLIGTILGIAPFLVLGILMPGLFNNERWLFYGIAPLVLVPVTFAYAIVRYQLLNVQVIVKKSLLYTLLTALVTGIYALVFAGLNKLFSGFLVQDAPIAPFVIALIIIVAIDPLRRRLQGPVDRLFFRERYDYQQAILAMSEALLGRLELAGIVSDLTERLAGVLRVKGAALYLLEEERGKLYFAGASGATPDALRTLAWDEEEGIAAALRAGARPSRLASLRLLPSAEGALGAERIAGLADAQVELLVPFVSRGRMQGLLLLQERASEEPYTREDLQLIQTLANQGAIALDNARLHAQLTRQVELRRELEIAREIQAGLFPKTLPRLAGFEIYGRSLPAREVGGDFYDFIVFARDGLPGERLGIVIGDVASKSVPAALLMVAAKEIVFAKAHENKGPAVIFRESSSRIYEIKNRMFVALGYFLLDCGTRTLTYALAGQAPPIVVGRADGEIRRLPAPEFRLPLGALRDVPYDERSAGLAAGDLVCMYTDGVTEAMDGQGNLYGEERLEELLRYRRGEPLEDLATALVDDLHTFAGGQDQYDDITVVLLRAQ